MVKGAGSSAGSCKQSVLVAACRLGQQKCAEKFRRILGSSELDKEQGAGRIRTIVVLNINSFANRSLLRSWLGVLASSVSITGFEPPSFSISCAPCIPSTIQPAQQTREMHGHPTFGARYPLHISSPIPSAQHRALVFTWSDSSPGREEWLTAVGDFKAAAPTARTTKLQHQPENSHPSMLGCNSALCSQTVEVVFRPSSCRSACSCDV